jgi:hypothetical protein
VADESVSPGPFELRPTTVRVDSGPIGPEFTPRLLLGGTLLLDHVLDFLPADLLQLLKLFGTQNGLYLRVRLLV